MKFARPMVVSLFLLGSAVTAEPSALQHVAVADSASYINANSVLMFVSNAGWWGYDFPDAFGYFAGTFYPFTSVENIRNGTQTSSPLYSAGLWIGGTVDGTPRVTVADFATEYWPGPMVAGTYIPSADTADAYRVYKLYVDSLESNPNQDYLDWPESLGAPTDELGQPALRGTQTMWCVYNDANPAQHTLVAGSTQPLGIEVRQTTWASAATGQERIIYMEFQLFNEGTNAIHDCYVGFYFDPDIGGAQDDFTGSDTLGQFYYSYNADNDDTQYGTAPPALGIKLVRGPTVPSMGDTAWYFGEQRIDHRNLPLTAYIGYYNGGDPWSALWSYRYLRGLQWNGTPLSNGTTFTHPGDPVSGTGDIQTIPGNPHGIGSAGPFAFLPGDSQSVIVKIGIGQGADRLSSVTDLREVLAGPDSIVTGIETENPNTLPSAITLHQNYPNPFNPGTTIAYTLDRNAHVELQIYDLLGRKIYTLVSKYQLAGEHSVVWDGTLLNSQPAASGMYLYRLQAGDQTLSRKMVLVK